MWILWSCKHDIRVATGGGTTATAAGGWTAAATAETQRFISAIKLTVNPSKATYEEHQLLRTDLVIRLFLFIKFGPDEPHTR